jgi:hypothetical protein
MFTLFSSPIKSGDSVYKLCDLSMFLFVHLYHKVRPTSPAHHFANTSWPNESNGSAGSPTLLSGKFSGMSLNASSPQHHGHHNNNGTSSSPGGSLASPRLTALGNSNTNSSGGRGSDEAQRFKFVKLHLEELLEITFFAHTTASSNGSISNHTLTSTGGTGTNILSGSITEEQFDHMSFFIGGGYTFNSEVKRLSMLLSDRFKANAGKIPTADFIVSINISHHFIQKIIIFA